LYCSRLGRGGRGSALDIRISFQMLPGVRTIRAERRFVTFRFWVGGHCPFRGLDAPLGASFLYHDLVCDVPLAVPPIADATQRANAVALPGLNSGAVWSFGACEQSPTSALLK
jgi:hypothetical protein